MNSFGNILSELKNKLPPSFSRHLNRILPVMVLLSMVVWLSGCITYYSGSASPSDYYYINPDKSLSSIGRVAVIELNNNSSYPKVSSDVTQKLYQALQKKQIFGLTVISQNDPIWKSLQLDLDSKYTLDQIIEIHRTLQCDAILIGTITEFRPYPHMIMGLRLKLLDLTEGQLLWGLEQIWDSADKTTEYRIKNYFRSKKRSGFEPLKEELTSVSSLEFIKFVSFEVAETL